MFTSYLVAFDGPFPRGTTWQPLTFPRIRRDSLKMEPSTEPMTPIKRKDVDGTSDNDEPHKKMKQEEEEAGFPTPQPGAGLTQGPDDASITSLFSLLLYGINTFVQAYFLGYPYLIPRKNDQKEFFESLTGSDCIAYLKSKHPGAKQAIITAAVWVKLIRALLGVPTKAFIEEMPEMKIKRGTAGKLSLVSMAKRRDG